MEKRGACRHDAQAAPSKRRVIYSMGVTVMTETQSILHNCLYFTANSLSRVITRMADEAFRRTGLSPSHAFLMMLVNDHPGIGQTELCVHLHLAPSTVTRFIDALVYKGYLNRQSDGKASRVYATETGEALREPIVDAWKSLHQRYADILGRQYGDALTAMIDDASRKLSEQA
jgi:DNA-binding MarR family transcriptional regulator